MHPKDRQFKVKVNKDYSDIKTFNYSVPQGSCNGPAYYCLYASTIRYHIENSIELNAFADDHTINATFDPAESNSESNIIRKIEQNLVSVHDWMNQNRLKMKTAKTELVYFGSNKLLQKSDCLGINVIHDTVDPTKCIRYLGAWLDETLNFRIHVK